PGMEGHVVVLPAGSTAPLTPEQSTAQGKQEMAEDTAKLQSFVAQAKSASATSGSVTAKTVNVGISFAGAGSDLAMLPDAVTVKRGDILTFTNADSYEIHTVTYLPAGETPPNFPEIIPNPMGPPDIFLPAKAVTPTGSTFTGSGYFNSGVLSEGQAVAVTFD